MSVNAELRACIGFGSFVGAATIVNEESFTDRRKLLMVRNYALRAIKAGKYQQAQHLAINRYPHLMTVRVRRMYWMTIWP